MNVGGEKYFSDIGERYKDSFAEGMLAKLHVAEQTCDLDLFLMDQGKARDDQRYALNAELLGIDPACINILKLFGQKLTENMPLEQAWFEGLAGAGERLRLVGLVVHQALRDGETLFAALRRFPEVFHPILIALVEVATKSENFGVTYDSPTLPKIDSGLTEKTYTADEMRKLLIDSYDPSKVREFTPPTAAEKRRLMESYAKKSEPKVLPSSEPHPGAGFVLARLTSQ